MSSLSFRSMMGNKIDEDGAEIIVEVAKSKQQLISLCGIDPDETLHDFTGQGLDEGDILLLAFAPSNVPSTGCDVTVPAVPGALHDAVDRLSTGFATSPPSKSDFVVCLEGGEHLLGNRPLRLGPSHNHPGGGSVTWRGIGSERPRIKAAAPLTKWGRCGGGSIGLGSAGGGVRGGHGGI